MTTDEKLTFVKDLTGAVTQTLIDKLPKVPDEWNGFELRQWIADEYQAQTFPMDRKRNKNYRNEVLVRNL